MFVIWHLEMLITKHCHLFLNTVVDHSTVFIQIMSELDKILMESKMNRNKPSTLSLKRAPNALLMLLAVICTFLVFCPQGAVAQNAFPVLVYKAADPPPIPLIEEFPLLNSVTQHDGITWSFSASVRVGRFVSGDYYLFSGVAEYSEE
jgi:energy-converting hydrogenase Eha subunit G